MHSIIHPKTSHARRSDFIAESFRDPHYDCAQMGETVKLSVYVPGVEASGVEITQRGPDLIVTARKAHFVRVNWKSLHLENAQRDYRLTLRLGNHLDYHALRAELSGGVLKISIPKRGLVAEPLREVA